MIERDYLVELYEIYKNLLTDREKEYFEYYYFEDYSLNEIAEVYDVSKSYVSKFLSQISEEIISFENKLSLYNKRQKIKKVIDSIDVDTKSKIEELLW